MGDAPMSRAMRLLRLIDMLNERGYTTEELAARLGVAQRTVQKDLQDLRDDPMYLQLRCRVRYEYRLLGQGDAKPAP